MRTVKVPLADRSYPIRIGSGFLADLGAQCARLKLGRRCAVISDSTVARRYRKPALASLKAAGFEPINWPNTGWSAARLWSRWAVA